MLELEAGSRDGVLDRAVDLRVVQQAVPFVHVPVGARFRVLEQAVDEMRRISFWFPEWDYNNVRLTIAGWVPVSLLPAIPEVVEGDAILGRLTLEGAVPPFDFQGFTVGASSEDKEGGPSTAVTEKDGRFVIKVQDSGPFRLDARSPDGALAGAIQDVTAFPGGDAEVTIPLRRSVLIEGRVRNRAGAWLPNVAVLAMAKDANRPSVRTVTDLKGRFRMSVFSGKYMLSAHEPGEMWSDYIGVNGPGKGVVL